MTGSAFIEVVAVPRESFSVSGSLRTFANAGDSGRKLDRKFFVVDRSRESRLRFSGDGVRCRIIATAKS